MSVKDVTTDDLALIELKRSGRTDAPQGVLLGLQDRGFLKLKGDKPELTTAGYNRAAALADAEHGLRLMAANTAAGRMPLTTAAGPALHG